MALTDATPENSCLYIIPKTSDPGYLLGDNDDDSSSSKDNNPTESKTKDPLSRALPTKQSYQHIRALPRRAGQSVFFTHRTLHWGSRGTVRRNGGVGPRIAVSFVASDPAFERPYLTHWRRYWDAGSEGGRRDGRIPPFRIRLLLTCAQLLVYRERFDLTLETVRACYDYCRENRDELDDGYWKKISVEYLKAVREGRGVGGVGGDGSGEGDGVKGGGGTDVVTDREEDNNSEEEDNILDAMLENTDHSEVGDDYDEMEDNYDHGARKYDIGGSDGESSEEEEADFGSLFKPKGKKEEEKKAGVGALFRPRGNKEEEEDEDDEEEADYGSLFKPRGKLKNEQPLMKRRRY